MKKLLIILAAVGLLFAMSSCDKKCTCKTYKDGKVTNTHTYEIDKDSDKKCSDYAGSLIVEVDGKKNGVECK
jgi:hypothetical protein